MTNRLAPALAIATLVSASLGGPPAARAESAGPLSARANYILRCTGCHGLEGAGSEIGGIPDFRGYVGAFSRTGDGRAYLMHVPGVVNSSLTNAEIAAVMNYVMQTFGGPSLPANFKPFTVEEVDALRTHPVEDVVAYRRDVVKALTAAGIATAGYPWP